MKRSILVLLLALLAFPLFAADETQNLLEAKRIGGRLRFTAVKMANGSIEVQYLEPKTNDVKTLLDGVTFVIPDQVDLTYFDFNPFLVSISSTEAQVEDPNAKAIGDFASLLLNTAKGFAPGRLGGSADGTEDEPPVAPATDQKLCEDCKEKATKAAAAAVSTFAQNTPCNKGTNEEKADCVKEHDLKTIGVMATAYNAKLKKCEEECKECIDFRNDVDALVAANTKLEKLPGGDELKQWRDVATGREGIKKAIDKIVAEAKSLDTKIEAAEKAVPQITELTIIARTLNCEGIDGAAELKKISDASSTIEKRLAAAQKIRESMGGLIKSLDAYKLAQWRPINDPNPTEYVFRTSTSDPDKANNIAVTIKLTEYTFEPKTSAFTSAATGEATRKLTVRQFRSFVPEVGMAVVYNELEYKKYSIKDGKVDEKLDETNVNAALTLNFLTNPLGGKYAYPGFQLGVSKVDDYPGILGGLVIRFARPEKFSIGLGGILTWYKEPKSLKKDDTATQEQLDKDLRRRSKAGWYAAVQYTF